jgi:hypothetical protein
MTDSEETEMGWEPVRIAESATRIDEEKDTGALGPAWEMGGRIECRLEEDEEDILKGR